MKLTGFRASLPRDQFGNRLCPAKHLLGADGYCALSSCRHSASGVEAGRASAMRGVDPNDPPYQRGSFDHNCKRCGYTACACNAPPRTIDGKVEQLRRLCARIGHGPALVEELIAGIRADPDAWNEPEFVWCDPCNTKRLYATSCEPCAERLAEACERITKRAAKPKCSIPDCECAKWRDAWGECGGVNSVALGDAKSACPSGDPRLKPSAETVDELLSRTDFWAAAGARAAEQRREMQRVYDGIDPAGGNDWQAWIVQKTADSIMKRIGTSELCVGCGVQGVAPIKHGEGCKSGEACFAVTEKKPMEYRIYAPPGISKPNGEPLVEASRSVVMTSILGSEQPLTHAELHANASEREKREP